MTRHARALGARRTLEYVLWLALVCGAIEVCFTAVKYFGFGQIVNRGIFFWWMIPASYVLLLAVAAGVIAVIGLGWRRLWQLEAVTFLVGGVGILSVLAAMLHGWIHDWALVLLALGLAAGSSRLAAWRAEAWLRLVRRTVPWLVTAAIAGGVVAHGVVRVREARAVARLPAAPPGARNVLLVIFDTVRGLNTSVLGYERRTTPELEQLARRGAVFERAISPSPWTLPAHASMFTGRQPSELSANWNTPLDATYPTVAEAFTRYGYRTAGFVANRDYATYQHGLSRGFLRYEDYDITLAEIFVSSGLGYWIGKMDDWRPLIGTDDRIALKRAERVGEQFLSWLDEGGEGPFFAFLNFYDAHDPYLPPDPWYRMFGLERPNRLTELRRRREDELPDSAATADEMKAYDGAIAYMDAQLGRIVRELEARGLAANTVIVVASDHGEEFGEHQLFFHGHALYATQLWVPLVIVAPGLVPENLRVGEVVSLRDLASTLVELAGLPERFPGASLARFWRGSTELDGDGNGGESWIVSEVSRLPGGSLSYPAAHGDLYSAIRGRFHYIRYAGGFTEVFDWFADPFERVPLRQPWVR